MILEATMFKKAVLTISLSVTLAVCSPASDTKQNPDVKAPGAPVMVQHSLAAVGAHPSPEVFYKQAREQLWEVYTGDESSKEALLEFACKAPDGPGVGFAVLGLIPFHDPATVKPLLVRAMDPKTSQATRWTILNSTPYILSMGDVMYMEDGKLDSESKEMAAGIQSAYLLGVLDARDENVVEVYLDAKEGVVFANVVSALAFASNRDFLGPLREKKGPEVTMADQNAVATKARDWWRDYSRQHRDWSAAILSGFREAGYKIEDDLKSPQSQSELRRAMDSGSEVTRYNAYRLLNQIYGTRFDIERMFMAGKYALSFLDPSPTAKQEESRLKKYWVERLSKKE
jgi:hypothetical protein